MIAGMFDPSVDMLHQDCMIVRTSQSNVSVYTKNPLTDEQMQDLYWLIAAMTRNNKRLKDFFPSDPIANESTP